MIGAELQEAFPESYERLLQTGEAECSFDRSIIAAEIVQELMPYYAPRQNDPINGIRHHDGSEIARVALLSVASQEPDSMILMVNRTKRAILKASMIFRDADDHEVAVYTSPSSWSKVSNHRQQAEMWKAPPDQLMGYFESLKGCMSNVVELDALSDNRSFSSLTSFDIIGLAHGRFAELFTAIREKAPDLDMLLNAPERAA